MDTKQKPMGRVQSSWDWFWMMLALGLFWLFIIALCNSGCTSTKLVGGVPNLAPVETSVYRGGQPTEAGWKLLKSLGVTNVIKLDTESEGSDSVAETLGMHVWRFPIDQWGQMTGDGVGLAITNAVAHLGPGTYVHCLHGQDRTGLAVALYRLNEGWRKSDAEKEMLTMGFHKALWGLWEYWEHTSP